MWDALGAANSFVTDYSKYEVTFVGHSKGGAEAAAAAIYKNCGAVIFNPATVNTESYDLDSSKYTKNMTVYIVEGDFLHSLERFFSDPIDRLVYLPNQSWSPLENHRMKSVKNALKEAGYKK